MVQSNGQNGRGTVFPIVEAFGFPYDSAAPEAAKARSEKACPFVGGLCEKYRQYHFGYCSVTYAANWNKGQQKTYAVCDHRLDGPPVEWAVTDYFGSDQATLVSEVMATSKPRLNIDYVAFSDDPSAPDGTRLIAIETQAIDLRGGGVGPAWEAWEADDVANWRAYFTAEAERKGRRDTVDYGVNTGNVYKRLGTQVAVKGEYFKQIDVPLYVVMQHSILEQLRSRINFTPVKDGAPWDITFAGFEYSGDLDSDGKLRLDLVESTRTTLPNYLEAMTSSREGGALRSDFVAKVRKKKKTPPNQQDLFTI
ncbi:hypothetical protein M2271_002204 [Streptomyces sp. LBL]|uniref:NotI family restriction endonuclease n=1 Tax=Streptomyces sp. LBL TaxID=2940562 RepID=UPI0024740079|nr:NotI family restriction endonuclease [Streptomyces sp. LBL]MDH6624402.1 hypothetical protein [Streptomyces sp. LBL]